MRSKFHGVIHREPDLGASRVLRRRETGEAKRGLRKRSNRQRAIGEGEVGPAHGSILQHTPLHPWREGTGGPGMTECGSR